MLQTVARVGAAVSVLLLLAGTDVWAQPYGQTPPKAEPAKPAPAVPSGEAKKATEKVATVAGKVKSVTANILVVQVSGKTPKEMTFDLSGTTVKAGGKDAAISDLKDGDQIRVSYTEADGKLIAKTVRTNSAKAKK